MALLQTPCDLVALLQNLFHQLGVELQEVNVWTRIPQDGSARLRDVHINGSHTCVACYLWVCSRMEQKSKEALVVKKCTPTQRCGAVVAEEPDKRTGVTSARNISPAHQLQHPPKAFRLHHLVEICFVMKQQLSVPEIVLGITTTHVGSKLEPPGCHFNRTAESCCEVEGAILGALLSSKVHSGTAANQEIHDLPSPALPQRRKIVDSGAVGICSKLQSKSVCKTRRSRLRNHNTKSNAVKSELLCVSAIAGARVLMEALQLQHCEPMVHLLNSERAAQATGPRPLYCCSGLEKRNSCTNSSTLLCFGARPVSSSKRERYNR